MAAPPLGVAQPRTAGSERLGSCGWLRLLQQQLILHASSDVSAMEL